MPNLSKFQLLELDYPRLIETLQNHNFPKYKIHNILNWIYKRSIFNFEDMSDLSKKERSLLTDHFEIITLSQTKMSTSEDGTLKFLFTAQDGAEIESVMIPNEDDSRYTICVSSQVGCALKCSFCATGLLGFKRNLTKSEIISQILLVDTVVKELYTLDKGTRAIDNIVFMGMGEPFLNYDNVIGAVNEITQPETFDIGTRRITISTSGIIEGIEKLAYAKGQVRLAVSLHAANHEKRKNIMPIARTQNTIQMLKALKVYQEKTNRRITFEYILIEGFNNLEEDVLALKHELQGLKYHLNLIPLNPVDQLPYDAPSSNCINDFKNRLQRHSIPFALRTPKGRDIDAACGQLALKNKS
ncbi:MAG: 23S rRNA (adenine(2503)-C(2))-methyltransferase RlmN [Brevinemataceae bacterium]